MSISPTVRRRRLGSEIKRLRDAVRMSGGTLAKKIGTSQPQLSRVENARGQLTAAQLEKLIKVFGVDERKAEEMRTLRRDGDVLGRTLPPLSRRAEAGATARRPPATVDRHRLPVDGGD